MDDIQESWYEPWIEELKALITEGEFNARWSLIETYHRLGKEILAKHDHFDRAKVYGEEIVQRVGVSLGRSQSTIWYAVQFAKKYPELSKLPGGKEMSWRKVLALLPGGEKKVEPTGRYLDLVALKKILIDLAEDDVRENPSMRYASRFSLDSLASAIIEKPKLVTTKPDKTMATNHLMSFFKKTYDMKKMYGERDVSRYACLRLLKEHGEEKLKKLIEAAYAVHDKPYAPKITSFLDLEKKLYDLQVYYKRKGNETPSVMKIR